MAFPPKPSQKRFVYLDHAAATPVDSDVKEAMDVFHSIQFGNPSSLYGFGQEARKAVEDSRKTIAAVCGAQPDTIIFTGSGTEANNMGVMHSVSGSKERAPGHVITTTIEHHAVLNACQQMEKNGYDVTYLPVDAQGYVHPQAVRDALREDTVLVSVMYANNEIGTIEPIAEIGRELLKWRQAHGRRKEEVAWPYFHVDACQAAGFLDLNVEKLHVDSMALNGSKIYGPKGIGVLYKRRGVSLTPVTYGGGQEFGLRAGTENVAGIVGMAKALESVHVKRESAMQEMRSLCAYLWKRIQDEIPNVILNGPPIGETRLPNNLNVTCIGVEAEALVLYLDSYGIAVGTGSACTTGSDEGSHVLKAIGKTPEEIETSVRFTLGKQNTKEDINYVMNYLSGVVAELRQM